MKMDWRDTSLTKRPYHYSIPDRPCDICGTIYQPHGHTSLYCSRPCQIEAQKRRIARYRIENPDYWREYEKARHAGNKTPKLPKPPYNPNLCQLCKQPLGYTWNQFFHGGTGSVRNCHARISSQVGMEQSTITIGNRGGHGVRA